MTAPTTPPAIAALDVPLARVTARIPACELAHLLDDIDGRFAVLAADHPEACSSNSDYPNWTPGGAR